MGWRHVCPHAPISGYLLILATIYSYKQKAHPLTMTAMNKLIWGRNYGISEQKK